MQCLQAFLCYNETQAEGRGMDRPRIVFMGTPEFAVGTLQSLVEEGYPVVAVVTGPDRPVGRHQDRLQAPAVKVYAEAHHLPVLQPEKLKNPEFLGQLAAFNANLQIVVAFRMLPEEVWAMPEYGTFNVHAALLPQYRGAAPINWAVINGETETGVTTFFIDKKIDTGRIILQKHLPIGVDDNVEKVYDGLEKLGAETALETIQKILRGNGKAESIPQSEMLKTVGPLKAAPKIHKDTCRIDWHQTAKHSEKECPHGTDFRSPRGHGRSSRSIEAAGQPLQRIVQAASCAGAARYCVRLGADSGRSRCGRLDRCTACAVVGPGDLQSAKGTG